MTPSITVAPIPASNNITITNTDASLNGQSLCVTDMQGREVCRFTVNAAAGIDISNWAAGAYSLRLPSGEVIRIIKR